MSSKNYGQKTCGTPPSICSDCKETSDSVKLVSSKVNKLEGITDNFYENPIKMNKNNQFSIFNNAKFTLNNAKSTLEQLRKILHIRNNY
ncbi:hypothetical protein RhiirA5_425150 [Rhizophagus irregularis]|uniref:Uncharacterized protein n=1 Tax=Rhizophagus irregularis TaxID=588596 RepID=A0A2N0P6S2_9GLOM|nr:hypothetical protein RhiirA5_425150 [Rhizophagus irregularis]